MKLPPCMLMRLPILLLLLLPAPSAADGPDLLSRTLDHRRAETRQVLFGRGQRDHLLNGWSQNEWNGQLMTHFVWANATESSVSFTLLDLQELQFLVRLVSPTPDSSQRITVLVNGKMVARISPEPTYLEYRFVAPREALRRGENRLTFRHGVWSAQQPLAAAYSSLLFGPNCLPLRPRGHPEPPPLARREQGRLLLRGPIEIGYRLTRAASRQIEIAVSPGRRPANLVVHWLPEAGAGSRAELARFRIRPGWFGSSERRHTVQLPADSRPGELRLEVMPDSCRDAASEISLTGLSILGNQLPPGH